LLTSKKEKAGFLPGPFLEVERIEQEIKLAYFIEKCGAISLLFIRNFYALNRNEIEQPLAWTIC
jgi:hypothetical protein